MCETFCILIGEKSQLVIVNHDGIPVVTVNFQHHSTILNFLECLESGLLPKGCLQPPLFYLKHHHKTQKKNRSDSDILNGTVNTHPVPMEKSNSSLQLKSASPDLELCMAVPHGPAKVVNSSEDSIGQVFTIWYGSRPVVKKSLSSQFYNDKKSSILMGEIPGEL